MRIVKKIDIQHLKSVINYNSETGVLTWIKSNNKSNIGKEAEENSGSWILILEDK